MGTKNKPGAFDCYANAEDDQPMFVLLAGDPDAPNTVEEWARRRFERLAREHTSVRYPEHESAAERERVTKVLRKIAEALTCATAMREWMPKPLPIEPLRPWPVLYPERVEPPRRRMDFGLDLRGQGE